MSNDWTKDVNDFMIRALQLVPDGPSLIGIEEQCLRLKLIKEELDELVEGLAADNVVAIADAGIDLIYVTLGTLLAYGIDPRPIWDIIQKANMSKFGGETTYDDLGKVLKPKDWKAPEPQIEKEINRQKDNRGSNNIDSNMKS